MSSIVANGIRQFYRREGDRARPAVILAHPIGFDHGLWDALVPLVSAAFHVIRYDLRGHGASETTPDPYSVELLAQDALHLTTALGVDSFNFVGTSLGGLVGLQIAATEPKRLRSLVVANASARLPLPSEEWNRRIALAMSSGLEPFVAGMVERMFSAGYRQTNGPGLHTLVGSFLAMDPRGYAAAMAALRDADLKQLFSAVQVPSLVVAGDEDAAVPREHSQNMASAIRGARLAVLPGGHLSAVEAPTEFAREVLSHFGA